MHAAEDVVMGIDAAPALLRSVASVLAGRVVTGDALYCHHTLCHHTLCRQIRRAAPAATSSSQAKPTTPTSRRRWPCWSTSHRQVRCLPWPTPTDGGRAVATSAAPCEPRPC